jgi:predicted GNAT family acetyltransferase
MNQTLSPNTVRRRRDHGTVNRILYRREPAVATAPAVHGIRLRPLADHDDAALDRLMERAYAGTIDDDLGDNNDGAVEIATWRGRGAMTAASFVAVGNDDEPVSASLVTAGSNGSAWISYVITNPGWKGRGLGTAVVAASLAALADTTVLAGITDGNTPSEKLFATLGFVRTGPAQTGPGVLAATLRAAR